MELRTLEPVGTQRTVIVRETDQPVKDADEAQTSETFAETLHDLALQIRLIIGTHQCALSFVPHGDFHSAVHTHSFSEKYERYNSYDVMPTGAGIWGLVVQTKQAVRMTQEEVLAHPLWHNFSNLRDCRGLEHPPLRGWLAAPVLEKSGEVLGVLQLSDKVDDGEFTARDLDLLIHLTGLIVPVFALQFSDQQLRDRKNELQAQRRAALNLVQDAVDARRQAEDNEAAIAIANRELQREIAQRQRTEENLRRATTELVHSNESLTGLNAELERAQEALARIASRLTMSIGPSQSRSYRLDTFSLTDMMHCGTSIRGMSYLGTKYEFGEALVRYFRDQMLGLDGTSAFALVRMFETQRFDELEVELRKSATSLLPEVTPQTMCLTLTATVGDQAEWNDVKLSRGHRAIPLPSVKAVEQLPMIAQLIRQFGLEVGGVLNPDPSIILQETDANVFHIQEARGSAFIPAQDSFVIPFGIRSVVGFGGLLPNGRLFAVILFSRVPISHDVALLFGHLALSMRMALLSIIDLPNKTTAQILSLDQLLHNHERVVASQDQHLRTVLAELARSNKELEQFAYIASHDLQEPLRKVQSFGDLLVMKYAASLNEQAQTYVKRMQDGARRMQALINDLLSYARVTSQAKPFVRVDLARVAQEAVSDLETRIKATGGQVNICTMPFLDGDPLQMHQLLQNLIGNALKFHRADVPPVVVVQGRVVENGDGAVLQHFPFERCEITVEDNGIGFEEKYLDRIFSPFQRLHGRGEYEGTGIGLAICRKIVERHGGTITARSTPGQGTTFIVALPLRQAKEKP